MKIRTGFVSNSSSASFIIAFKDKTVADIFSKVFQHSSYIRHDETSLKEIKKEHGFHFDNIVVLDVPYGSEEMFNADLMISELQEYNEFECKWGD